MIVQAILRSGGQLMAWALSQAIGPELVYPDKARAAVEAQITYLSTCDADAATRSRRNTRDSSSRDAQPERAPAPVPAGQTLTDFCFELIGATATRECERKAT